MAEKPDFSEFLPTTKEEWTNLVAKELGKGSPDVLNWTTDSGFTVDAYFVPSEVNTTKEQSSIAITRWGIHQHFKGSSITSVREEILTALEGGVNSIGLEISVPNFENFKELFQGIFIEMISIHFVGSEKPLQTIDWFLALAFERNIPSKSLRGSISCSSDIAQKRQVLSELTSRFVSHFSLFHVLVIDAKSIHQKGGNAVQEIAFALAQGQELLTQLTEKGIGVDDASAMCQFSFASGPSYFQEIAKFRAFRTLWSEVVKAYKPEYACSLNAYITATTSAYYQTAFDAHSNLLRSTSSAMSAIIGGANELEVVPYDQALNATSENGMRWARNVQHLLIEESYFDQYADAAHGSYYIQAMEENLCSYAWKLFLEIEEHGGIVTHAQEWNRQLEESKNRLEQSVKDGKRTVLGVNKYPPTKDFPVDFSKDRLTSILEKERMK